MTNRRQPLLRRPRRSDASVTRQFSHPSLMQRAAHLAAFLFIAIAAKRSSILAVLCISLTDGSPNFSYAIRLENLPKYGFNASLNSSTASVFAIRTTNSGNSPPFKPKSTPIWLESDFLLYIFSNLS